MNIERIPLIDFLRGMVMLFIVMGHVLNRLHFPITNLEIFIADVSLPVFFLLSGYLGSRSISTTNWGRLILKKLMLLIPFFTVGGLYTLFHSTKFINLFVNLYHCGYWFLPVLFFFFLVSSVCFHLCNKFNPNIRNDILIFLVLPYAIFTAGMYCFPIRISHALSWPLVTQYYLFFAIGPIFCRNGLTISKLNEFFIFRGGESLILIILFFPLSIYITYHWNIESNLYFGINALLKLPITFGFLGLIIKLFQKQFFNEKLAAAIVSIGFYSLDIYLLHYFMLPSSTIPGINSCTDFIYVLPIAVGLASLIVFFCIFAGKIIRDFGLLRILFLGSH